MPSRYDKTCRQKANLRIVSSNSLGAPFAVQKVVTEDVYQCGALWSLTPRPGFKKRNMAVVLHLGLEVICIHLCPQSL